MMRLSVLLAFCAICRVNWAQNGYNYDRPDLSIGITSTSQPGFAGASPVGYPSASGFSGVAGPSTPVYQLGSTAYPSGRPSSIPQSGPADLSGGGGYPISGKPDFTGPSAFQGTAAGDTRFRNVGTAPGYPGSNAGIPSTGFLPTGEGQQRPSVSSTQFGRTGPSADFAGNRISPDDGQSEEGSYAAIPGEPGVDYPIFSDIPETSFDCKQQAYPGYYADIEAQCQVFHICALNRTFNFLCPNGTIFSQENFVCVWWNQFECSSAPGLFEKNSQLYISPQPGRPSTDGFSSIQTGITSGLTGPSGPTAGGAPYAGRRVPSVGQQGSSVGPPRGVPVGQQGSGLGYSTGLTGYPAAGGPTGLGFPSGQGQQGYPGPGQSDEQFPLIPQNPIREYLPPKQG